MNNSSPLIPQGSLLERQNRGRSRFRTAMLCVFGAHILLFCGVLMLGCSHETAKTTDAGAPTNVDTSMAPASNTDLSTATSSLPPVPASNVVQTPPPTPVPPPAPTTSEYVVVKGDTYSSIGKKFGVSYKALEEANPTIPATKLQPGKKIQIPAATAAVTSAGTAMLSADTADLYVVKAGDSLTKIATNHGTTVKALKDANSLKTDKIKVGDKLRLPAKAPAAMPAPDAGSAPATATTAPPVIPAPASGGTMH